MSRFGVLGVLLVAAACSSSPPAESASTSLMVAAAASLQDAFEEIASAYEEETGVEIALSFEASSTLRTRSSGKFFSGA